MMNPQAMLLTQYWKAELELRRERRGAGQRTPALARRGGWLAARRPRPGMVA